MFTANRRFYLRLVVALVWLSLLLASPEPLILFSEYGGFAFLGVIGALFANATGAGGGVVFVPFFQQLEFTPVTTVATSYAIQCCGMTAGALTWWAFYRQHQQNNPEWAELTRTLSLTVPFSLLGTWLAQWYQWQQGELGGAQALHLGFGVFSIVLALAIFTTLPKLKKTSYTSSITISDAVTLRLTAALGGIITAWLSIGVGELVAVYLIIRGFNATFAIAVAVILSAFSVWAGILYHLILTQAVYWPVVMFAGAGAIIGGILAKQLVLYFSATHLKIFFAGWILLLGVGALF